MTRLAVARSNPTRASDLPAFLANGMQTDRGMRKVRFGLIDRLAVIPVELVVAGRWLLLFLGLVAWYRLIRGSGDWTASLRDLIPFALAVVISGVGVAILLPWLPARSFAAKGWILGVLGTLLFAYAKPELSGAALLWLFFTVPAVSAFVSLNFTGASTYTSLSGVEWETRRSLPLIVVSLLAGMAVRVVWS